MIDIDKIAQRKMSMALSDLIEWLNERAVDSSYYGHDWRRFKDAADALEQKDKRIKELKAALAKCYLATEISDRTRDLIYECRLEAH